MFHQASNSCHQIFIGVCFRIFGSFGSHDIEIIPVLQDIVGLVEKIDPLGRGRLNFSEFCRGMQAVMQGGSSKTKIKIKTKIKTKTKTKIKTKTKTNTKIKIERKTKINTKITERQR